MKECKDCVYRTMLEEERRLLVTLQKEYLDKIDNVNKTLAKYTKKMENV